MRSVGVLICVGALSLSLGGCEGAKRALGMEKTVPNEFDVVANAPLAIPPDFALRPPKPGAAPTQAVSSSQQAKETIFRAAGDQNAALPAPADQRSPGEDQLLRAAGASTAPDNIRDTVNKEATEGAPFNKSFIDQLVFWRDDSKKAGKDVLDPMAEAERLRTKDASSATIATEFTSPPTIERKKGNAAFFGLF